MRSVFLLFSLVLISSAQTTPISALDVEYSAVGQRVSMDIYRPANDAPRAAVLLVHGGGFRAGTRESYSKLATRLAQHGYVAATVTYRLAPQFPFPAAVHDVKAAVRFLRANAKQYHIDPDRIGALGSSAGGHLVLFLGLTANVPEWEGTGPNQGVSSRVQCVADYYGPSDFTQSYAKSVDAAEVLPLFLEGDLVHKRQAHIRASPSTGSRPMPPLSWPSTAPRTPTSPMSNPFGCSNASSPPEYPPNSKPSPALGTVSKAPMPIAPTPALLPGWTAGSCLPPSSTFRRNVTRVPSCTYLMAT